MIDITHASTRLISLKEAAAILGVSRMTMHRYAATGQVECVFCGSRRRTTREAIQRFLQRSTESHCVPVVGVSEDLRLRLQHHGIE